METTGQDDRVNLNSFEDFCKSPPRALVAQVQFITEVTEFMVKRNMRETTRLIAFALFLMIVTSVILAFGLRSANKRIEALENAAALAEVKHEQPNP